MAIDRLGLKDRLHKVMESGGIVWFGPGVDRDLPAAAFHPFFRDFESICVADRDFYIRLKVPQDDGGEEQRTLLYRAGEIVAALRNVELEPTMLTILGQHGVGAQSVVFGEGGYQSPFPGVSR